MQNIDKNNYTNFFNQIVQMIEEARYNAFQSINKHNIRLNYNIGKTIVEKQLKQKDDNPTIGIILCSSKDNIEVEFVLSLIKKPIGVAEYLLTKELPKKLQGKLPTAKELSDRFFNIDNELKDGR